MLNLLVLGLDTEKKHAKRHCTPTDLKEVNKDFILKNMAGSSSRKCLHACKEIKYLMTSTSGTIDELVVEEFLEALNVDGWKTWSKNKYALIIYFIFIFKCGIYC